MRSLLAVVLLTACGSSPKPAPAPPAPAPAPAADAEGDTSADDEQVRAAGILGSQKLEQGGAFASLTGTGDISSGFDDANIYGGLLGEDNSWWGDDELGELSGGFGYGRSGFGPADGTGWGTIGTGRYGQIGHTGSGYGVGSGRGGMRGRTAHVPTVTLGAFTAVGDLDKAIIRRYIRRNLPKISYCYEKELLAKLSLAGSVAVSFTIDGNGATTVQKSSSANHDMSPVSQCVQTVIGGIQFPKPKNGGNVKVDFPFTFSPSSAPVNP